MLNQNTDEIRGSVPPSKFQNRHMNEESRCISTVDGVGMQAIPQKKLPPPPTTLPSLPDTKSQSTNKLSNSTATQSKSQSNETSTSNNTEIFNEEPKNVDPRPRKEVETEEPTSPKKNEETINTGISSKSNRPGKKSKKRTRKKSALPGS